MSLRCPGLAVVRQRARAGGNVGLGWARAVHVHMAGLAMNPVQVFSTGRAQFWEFFRLRTGFELPSSCVAIINPLNGAIEGVIDFRALKKKVTQHQGLDVLNGLAWNPTSQTLFVTGKRWDKLFEVKIIEQ